MDPEIDILDLQAALRADPDGQALRQKRDQLETLRLTTRRSLDRGVSPAEFKRMDALLQAGEAAREVIDYTWQAYHPQPR